MNDLKPCDYCIHVEMCGWRKDVEEQGCEFYDDGNKWIPFKGRALEEPEQDEYPDEYIILDCPLPEDGQRILVTIDRKGHESVQLDEFYTDDGAYLDSGYDLITEAVAWQPLPKPYVGGTE